MDERLFQGMEYIYEVYREGSFQKAAQKLMISQPSISASVKRIEDRLGCRIFDRSTKPMRLTECGERYIESVEKIFALERDFAEYVNDWGGLRTGHLVLGGTSMFSSLVLPPVMRAYKEKYPEIRLELLEETSMKLETMLQDGHVDFIIDYDVPNSENCESRILEEDSILLAVPAAYEINRKLKAYRYNAADSAENVPGVPLEAFGNEPFILLKPENDTRRRADEICAASGFRPNVVLELDQQMSAYLVCRSGMGVSFVSSTLVSRMDSAEELVFYRLGGEASRRQVRLFWKKGRYITRAMEAFVELAGGREN